MAALTFPLALNAFFDTLDIADVTFEAPEPINMSRTAGGEVIKSSLGPALWQGSVSLLPGSPEDIAAIEALLSLVGRPGASFMVYDPRKSGPRADPTGSILGASTPTLESVDADMRRLSIEGLPNGYVLSPGDMLAFTYGSNPTRYALHRIIVGATADGLGVTPLFEVTPMIRTGATAGAAVTLVKPACKAVLKDAASYGGGQFGVSSGPSFEFIQTLR